LNRVEFEELLSDGRLIIVYYDPKSRWYNILYNKLNEDSMMIALIHSYDAKSK